VKRFSLYSAIVLLVGIFSSCSDVSNPAGSSAQFQSGGIMPRSSVSFLALPERMSTSRLDKEVSPSVVITPEAGGDVPFNYSYTDKNGKPVSIAMNLHFAPGIVTTSTPVSITLDTESLIADFSPSMGSFAKDVICTATVTGVDLASVPDGADVKLFYINDEACETMGADAISYDKSAGTVTLSNGRIPHFSLYGFGFLK